MNRTNLSTAGEDGSESTATTVPSHLQQQVRGARIARTMAPPILIPAGADSNMIRSGHSDFNTLYASNDVVAGRENCFWLTGYLVKSTYLAMVNRLENHLTG